MGGMRRPQRVPQSPEAPLPEGPPPGPQIKPLRTRLRRLLGLGGGGWCLAL